MTEGWRAYIHTMVAIWAYTFLVIIVYTLFAITWPAAIIGVAVCWSIFNYLLLTYNEHIT